MVIRLILDVAIYGNDDAMYVGGGGLRHGFVGYLQTHGMQPQMHNFGSFGSTSQSH